MTNYFSSNLEYLRKQKGMSQNKLGELIGVNQTTVARWEKQEMAPSIDNVEEVANVLNVKLPDMLVKDLRINNPFNELELLFDKNKDILTKDDMEYIKFIIEKRKKEIDKELGKD